MKKIIVAAVLAVLSLGAVAQADVWTRGYVWNAASNSGQDVWLGPGNKVQNISPLESAVNNQLASGGINTTRTGAVALRDGRTATLAATRFASTANIFKGVKAVAGGPLGVTLLLMEAMPALLDWINADNSTHIRWNSNQLQRKVDSSLFHVTCQGQVFSGTGVSLAASCSAAWNAVNGCGIVATFTSLNHVYSGATAACPYGMWDSLAVRDTTSNDWLPASMADIEPYMTPRVPAAAILSQIVGAGQPVDVVPVSVTTVTAPPALTPYVETTTYPKPADRTTTVMVPGNPYSLPNNTPTVTNQSTSEKLLNPGSTSKTGVSPAGNNSPAPAPVNTPTQSTTTSTFNPTTNQTTSDTVTSQDAAQQVSTSTTTTTINNTSNTSNVTYNTTNVTNITNTTTNTQLAPTKTDISNNSPTPTPTPSPDPVDPCEGDPDRVGCLKLGAPPVAEVLSKTTQAVTITSSTFAGAGSCPADVTFSAVGHSYSFSYASLCARMSALAALFLAMAAMFAAWIFVSALKV